MKKISQYSYACLKSAFDDVCVASGIPLSNLYELDGTVLRAPPYAADIGELAAPLWEQINAIDDAAEAARLAAEEAARNAPPPVPFSVTRRQLFLELAAQGITRAAIRAQLEAIADATTREAALIEFDEALQFERAHPLIGSLGQSLALSSAQVDALFIAAAAR
jgi:hypothetical protein